MHARVKEPIEFAKPLHHAVLRSGDASETAADATERGASWRCEAKYPIGQGDDNLPNLVRGGYRRIR